MWTTAVSSQEKSECLMRVYATYRSACVANTMIVTDVKSSSNGSFRDAKGEDVVSANNITISTTSISDGVSDGVVLSDDKNTHHVSTTGPTSTISSSDSTMTDIQRIRTEFECAHVGPLSPAATQRLVDGLRGQDMKELPALSTQYLPYVSDFV